MQAVLAQLEIARPAWLAALLLVPLVALWPRRSLTGFSPARRAASVAARAAVIAAIVLALCGMSVTSVSTGPLEPLAAPAVSPPGTETPGEAVLLVEGQPLAGGQLAQALESERIKVEVRRPDGLPAEPEQWQRYALVMLVNVPAASLAEVQMEQLRAYVGEFGGGLIVVGGDQAFTPGGYRNTALEDLLPVRCESGTAEERPSLALVLVIDRSGSMREGGAIELAKEATRRAVEMLGPGDEVGVIAFQDYSQWISPLQPCSDKAAVLDRVATIAAAGGTNMYPALDRAYLALRESFAERKHVILLSDGISHPGDFDRLAREMAGAGITLSTVAVGPEAAGPLLEGLARIAKGHYYYCDTAAALPDVFALETATAGRMGIVERPFHARVETPLEALAGADLAAAPSLLGYVKTKARPTAQVVMTAERGDPLLAWWRFGAGTVAAFTSDAQSRWAPAWLRWRGFGRFWSRLARAAMRKKEDAARPAPVDSRPDLHHTVSRTTQLWSQLLILAAVLYVVDVAIRRVRWQRLARH